MKLTPISGQGTSSWQSDGDPTELHEKHLGIVAEKKIVNIMIELCLPMEPQK